MAGYSSTPLAKKLTYKPGLKAWFSAMPTDIADVITRDVPGLILVEGPEAGLDIAHLFVTQAQDLDAHLTALRPLLAPAGMIWVSWPKKASKRPTDITEDTIRSVCLPLGFVDIKVCAVDEVWSGLKLVIRKELRG